MCVLIGTFSHYGECLFVSPSESSLSSYKATLMPHLKPDSAITIHQDFFTSVLRLHIPTPLNPPHGITRSINHQAFPHRSRSHRRRVG